MGRIWQLFLFVAIMGIGLGCGGYADFLGLLEEDQVFRFQQMTDQGGDPWGWAGAVLFVDGTLLVVWWQKRLISGRPPGSRGG